MGWICSGDGIQNAYVCLRFRRFFDILTFRYYVTSELLISPIPGPIPGPMPSLIVLISPIPGPMASCLVPSARPPPRRII